MKETVKETRIHPVADLFPMMPDEELQDLASDIRSNGLLLPIVIDDAGQVIDGRNRLAACRLAQVEPQFEQLNGRDPVAYIVSANLARRNLSKGQQAILCVGISRSAARPREKRFGIQTFFEGATIGSTLRAPSLAQVG